MTKHPRASDLKRLVQALESAGKSVHRVEVRWEEKDGRDVPVWSIVLVGDDKPRGGEVEW